MVKIDALLIRVHGELHLYLILNLMPLNSSLWQNKVRKLYQFVEDRDYRDFGICDFERSASGSSAAASY
jgi:hypothetical protein